jgi:methionyl aminopeptidase
MLRSPFSLSSSLFWTFQRRSMPRVLVRSCSSAAEAVADGTHEDFGDYCIILPKEPFVFGTSQITPRLVPEYIVKPSYVTTKDDSTQNLTVHKDIGKIKLGAQEELQLRKAALLARKVREFAKSLVQVWQHASSKMTPN